MEQTIKTLISIPIQETEKAATKAVRDLISEGWDIEAITGREIRLVRNWSCQAVDIIGVDILGNPVQFHPEKADGSSVEVHKMGDPGIDIGTVEDPDKKVWECKNCGPTTRVHQGRGLCSRCYSREYYKKKGEQNRSSTPGKNDTKNPGTEKNDVTLD